MYGYVTEQSNILNTPIEQSIIVHFYNPWCINDVDICTYTEHENVYNHAFITTYSTSPPLNVSFSGFSISVATVATVCMLVCCPFSNGIKSTSK